MKLIYCIAKIVPVLFLIGCSGASFVNLDPEINTDNLKQTVLNLTSITPPRNYLNKKSLEKSVEYISQKFIEYGFTPQKQKFIINGNTYENIIVSIGQQNGERVIVGAHYDVCGDQPGADDNASGIAGLLEIARFAKEHEDKLPYRVDIVAYSLEEPPFFGTTNMGSYVHAASLHEKNIKVRGMICLDMIGFFTDEKNSQEYPLAIMRLFYPDKGNFISIVSNFGSSSLAKQLSRNFKYTSIDAEVLKAPSFITGVDFSDHRNYWKFGFDAVMITDTAFYRNPNYHESSDTMDTLNFKRMKEVVKGICLTLINIK